MDKIRAVEVEMSLVPLYQGQPLMMEVVFYLETLGFTLIALQPAFWHPDGRLLQVDGIFAR